MKVTEKRSCSSLYYELVITLDGEEEEDLEGEGEEGEGDEEEGEEDDDGGEEDD